MASRSERILKLLVDEKGEGEAEGRGGGGKAKRRLIISRRGFCRRAGRQERWYRGFLRRAYECISLRMQITLPRIMPACKCLICIAIIERYVGHAVIIKTRRRIHLGKLRFRRLEKLRMRRCPPKFPIKSNLSFNLSKLN